MRAQNKGGNACGYGNAKDRKYPGGYRKRNADQGQQYKQNQRRHNGGNEHGDEGPNKLGS